MELIYGDNKEKQKDRGEDDEESSDDGDLFKPKRKSAAKTKDQSTSTIYRS